MGEIDRFSARRLREDLESAGLHCRVVDDPRDFSTRVRADTESFLMDIRKQSRARNERREMFVIYPGVQSDVQIMDVKPDIHQAVLRVSEPERSFEIRERKWNRERRKFDETVRIQTTPAGTRRYLVGTDELHLFFAELRLPAHGVRAAHSTLKPKDLRNADRSQYKRQGEWFLIPATDAEVSKLDGHGGISARERAAAGPSRPADGRGRPRVSVAAGIPAFFRSTALTGMLPRGRGRPHVADEVARMDGKEFARGNVRHPDHRTKKLHTWHRVERNTEASTASVATQNATWVD